MAMLPSGVSKRSRSCSIRHGSWFFSNKMLLKKILKLTYMYYWAARVSTDTAIKETSVHDGESTSTKTVVDWFTFCCEVCRKGIGGPDMTVEIDESKFGRGSTTEVVWLRMRRSVRIPKELSRLETEPPPGVSCWIKKDSKDQLLAQIIGGDNSPYSDGVFKLEIQVPEKYPMEPPKVSFLTPIYHPNIDTAGRICLDLLKMPPAGNWRPSLSIATLLTSIRQLMSQPNADDPLMADISAEFKTNRALFEQKARQHTQKHASQQSSNALTAKHQSNDSDQSDSSSDDDSDQSDSSSDENLAKRKSSQNPDDQMDTKKLKADNP